MGKGHTPYGYRIVNGAAVIDEKEAGQVRKLCEGYLAGMGLAAASQAAGIRNYHTSAMRMMLNRHYTGDDFYPAIIDHRLFDQAFLKLYPDFVNQFNGRKIIGTVGQLQFEVIQYRLLNEYNASCRWEPVHLYKACWIESDDEAELQDFMKRKYQYMAKDREGRDVYLADSSYVLSMAQQDFKHIRFHFTSEF